MLLPERCRYPTYSTKRPLGAETHLRGPHRAVSVQTDWEGRRKHRNGYQLLGYEQLRPDKHDDTRLPGYINQTLSMTSIGDLSTVCCQPI